MSTLRAPLQDKKVLLVFKVALPILFISTVRVHVCQNLFIIPDYFKESGINSRALSHRLLSKNFPKHKV